MHVDAVISLVTSRLHQVILADLVALVPQSVMVKRTVSPLKKQAHLSFQVILLLQVLRSKWEHVTQAMRQDDFAPPCQMTKHI